MFYVWLGIIILLTIVELLTMKLTTIWFVISGVVALLLSLVTKNFLIEFIVFIVLGVIFLIVTKPYIDKFLSDREHKKYKKNMVGMIGEITKEVKRNTVGEVVIDGKKWLAVANRKIKIGSTVEIIKIDGMKLEVKEIKDKN